MFPVIIYPYLASTSVETLPGTFFRISSPKLTNSLSMVLATCSSSVLNREGNITIMEVNLTSRLNLKKFYQNRHFPQHRHCVVVMLFFNVFIVLLVNQHVQSTVPVCEEILLLMFIHIYLRGHSTNSGLSREKDNTINFLL